MGEVYLTKNKGLPPLFQWKEPALISMPSEAKKRRIKVLSCLSKEGHAGSGFSFAWVRGNYLKTNFFSINLSFMVLTSHLRFLYNRTSQKADQRKERLTGWFNDSAQFFVPSLSFCWSATLCRTVEVTRLLFPQKGHHYICTSLSFDPIFSQDYRGN